MCDDVSRFQDISRLLSHFMLLLKIFVHDKGKIHSSV